MRALPSKALQLSPTLQVASQVEKTSPLGVEVIDALHIIRPSVMVSRYRHDSGLYPRRYYPDTRTVVCPASGTLKPSSPATEWLAPVATAALCCSLPSPSRFPSLSPVVAHHHKTYARFGGNELPSDIIACCFRCHSQFEAEHPTRKRNYR